MITELYGSKNCPYTQDMREWLELQRRTFIEYDVVEDPQALERMQELTGGKRSVPVLVEDGQAVQVGWQEHFCTV